MNNQVLTKCLFDENLSWKAKGLLCYLLNLPDICIICLNELKNHSSDGRDSTSTALKELIKYGYIMQKVNRDEKGLFTGYAYNITDSKFKEDKQYFKQKNKAAKAAN
ncbi:MAG TPA: helix-turn-helix domain-containing protein [Clostridia bacterium]